MEVKAVEKYIRISPKKARPVADVIRGQKATDALTVLRFMPKKGADVIGKALKSAVANAEHNFNADKDSLYIKSISVDNGPSLKRFRPRSRGMVSHILKRTSHVTVVVTDEAPAVPVKKVKAVKAKPEVKAAKKAENKKETPKETK